MRCPKSVFNITTKCYYTTWHWVKQILNVWFWRIIPYFLYVRSNCIFCSCRSRITSETLTNQIPHVLNSLYIRWIIRLRKKFHVLGWTVFETCGRKLSHCNIVPRMPWIEGRKKTSGCRTSWMYLLPLRLLSIRSKLDRPRYEIAPQIITPGVRPLYCSITHPEGSTDRRSV